MSTTRVILDPKRVSEVDIRPFDFQSKMVVGDVLSAPVITVTVWSGIDAAPSGVYAGSAAIAGSIVSPLLQAGVAGTIYLIAVSVTATGGKTLVLEGLLVILPEGM